MLISESGMLASSSLSLPCSGHALRRARRAIQSSMVISTGDNIIAGNDVPGLGIARAQGYELQRVYYQGVAANGTVEKVDVDFLEAAAPAQCAGYCKYLILYNARYHGESGPIVAKEGEVQIVTVKDEIADSAWLALPGLIWVWLAWSIYQYGERTGFIF